MVLLFLIGAGVFLYPHISQWVATRNSVLAVKSYIGEVAALPADYYDEMWQAAEAYNNELSGNAINDPFTKGKSSELPEGYKDMLNISGMMGYIEIPKIKLTLPIYHGVSEDVLQKGIGHMEGSALPTSQTGGNVLLTGHTGLPQALLFTDLDKLVLGDQFNLRVLNKEYVYQVDQIMVVKPDDVSGLMTVEDASYVTLITCTPYGINSHRLLVRGKQIATLVKEIPLTTYYFNWIFVGGGQELIYKLVFFGMLGLDLVLAGVLLKNQKKKRSRMKQDKPS